MRIAEGARPLPGKPVFSVSVETSPGKVQSLASNQLFSFRSGNSVQLKHEIKAESLPLPGAASTSSAATAASPETIQRGNTAATAATPASVSHHNTFLLEKEVQEQEH